MRARPLLVAAWLAAALGVAAAAKNRAELTFGYPVLPASGAITLDGTLTDAEWGAAVKVSGFTVSGRKGLAFDQTVMRLLYDRTHLYLGVKCSESQMAKLVVEHFGDDEAIWRDDCIEFFLDPTHSHEDFYQFIVNPAGARYDAFGKDRGWGCDWKVAIAKAKDAWHVEAAVPFKGLKVKPPRPGTVWGFNLARERMAGGGRQLYNWADVQGDFLTPSLFGHLWFVGAGWTPTAKSAAAAARRIQGTEARIFTRGGYWAARKGEAPKAWTYPELLRAQQGRLKSAFLGELRRFYAENPTLPLRKEFDELDGRYRAVEKLATTGGLADAEACAAAMGFIEGVEPKLANLYWKTRVELLNREF